MNTCEKVVGTVLAIIERTTKKNQRFWICLFEKESKAIVNFYTFLDLKLKVISIYCIEIYCR